jgi:hypothetical protein
MDFPDHGIAEKENVREKGAMGWMMMMKVIFREQIYKLENGYDLFCSHKISID